MNIPLLGRFLRRRGTIDALYGTIVAQARVALPYRDWGVPDSLEGRFEMVLLHLSLLLNRLAGENEVVRELGQSVFDRFCQDMDDHFRETGVGDLAVPKKMRGIADAFYGRYAAYRAALAESDPASLETAVERNVRPAQPQGAAKLAAYVRAAAAGLAVQDATALASGRVAWPDFDAISKA